MSKPVAGVAAACLFASLMAAGPALAEDAPAGLLGDWGGARPALAEQGLSFDFDYVGEVFGISGAQSAGRTASTYEGRFTLVVGLDLEQAFGWQGATVEAKGFQIHSAGNRNAVSRVGSISDPSNIDSTSTTRFYSFWFQQEFGFGSLRLGKIAADDDFLLSDTSAALLNSNFGWPTVMSANLPSGGPVYPMGAPGVRLRVEPTETVALIAAVLAGDPAGKNCALEDPQLCDRHGTKFSLSEGALMFGEVQISTPPEADAGLPGIYKLGVWHHSGNQHADQRFGLAGGVRVPLALEPPDALSHASNWGFYGVADQTVWQDDGASVALFLRAGWTPSDRNLVSRYVDAGLGVTGLFAGRPDDTLTIGVGHARISRAAAAADRDAGRPRRSAETVFEITYSAEILPGWTLQPDFQVIVRPGGGALRDDADPARGRLSDAKLFGLRTILTF